jgi:hypothetical protein
MGEGYYYLGDGGAAPWMPEAIRLSTRYSQRSTYAYEAKEVVAVRTKVIA